MNGKTTVPNKSWQAEHKKLIAERFSLFDEFYRLKDETRGVGNLMREENRSVQPIRKQDVEL